MRDFRFIKNPKNKKWVILAPRRSARPVEAGGHLECPFCRGVELGEKELCRVGGILGDSNWEILVVANKYPFSASHEIIIDSPSHVDSIETFPISHVQNLLRVYRGRYLHHHHTGQVVIFHNRGTKAGESISHSHTQLVVIPEKVNLPSTHLGDVVPTGMRSSRLPAGRQVAYAPQDDTFIGTEYFDIFCPEFSEWPDEVWVMPKRRHEIFGEVKDRELPDLAKVVQTIVRLLVLRHQEALAYNFSIFHGNDWYLRFVPREKVWGGFEVTTNVSVNTQKPSETFAFLKEHFHDPDIGKIFREHKADYDKRV